MISRMASTTIILFLSFSIIPLLTIVRANQNDYNPEAPSVNCPPPPPPCICNLMPPPPLPQQPAPPQTTLPPQAATPLPPPLPPKSLPPLFPPKNPPSPPLPQQQPPPQTTLPPQVATSPPLPPKPLPPLSPPQKAPPPPPATTPPLLPPSNGLCSKNDTELKICAEILSISDGRLTTGRAEPCCSIVRNISDVDAVTCLCKSVGARRFSLSPNFGIFFRVCGRRIPQGFSCPGPTPITPPPPLPPKSLPPLPPPPATTPPISHPLNGLCSKNDTELKICAEILSISDGLLTTGRAEPCCSIVRNISDVDAVTCFCKSVGARRSSLSPNFGIFFKVCGRRIPQGFSCP